MDSVLIPLVSMYIHYSSFSFYEQLFCYGLIYKLHQTLHTPLSWQYGRQEVYYSDSQTAQESQTVQQPKCKRCRLWLNTSSYDLPSCSSE